MGFSFHPAIKEAVDAYDILVPIANSADYRQVTGTFAITLSGIVLPMQIISQGQTDHCHPKFKFPDEFNITYSVNHWSNEEKAIELTEKVLLPYVRNKKEELDLRSTKKWVLIADMFKGQWTVKVNSLIEKHDGEMVPGPHNMTNYFQPFDLTANRSCKSFLRDKLKYGMQNKCRPKFAKELLQNVYLLI